MKKLIASILVFCFIFTVAALAAETTTMKMFTEFDFGKSSKVNNDAELMKQGNFGYSGINLQQTDDTWVFTSVINGSDTDQVSAQGCLVAFKGFCNALDDAIAGQVTLTTGWGTYVGAGYSYYEVYNPDQMSWQGRHQYLKIRLKNSSDNERFSFAFSDNTANLGQFAWTMIVGFDITPFDESFQTYYVDCIAGSCYQSAKFYGTNGIPTSNWSGRRYIDGIILHPLGAFCQMDGMSEYPQCAGLHTMYFIKKGTSIEIDYMVWGSTPAQLATYTSNLEDSEIAANGGQTTAYPETTRDSWTPDPSATTTTAKVEETTTVANETTTTVAGGDETTTIGGDETTTTVAGDETTTTVADGTTTTANSGSDSKGGNTTLIIIIVAAVVVIGGGVAAFFIFKK